MLFATYMNIANDVAFKISAKQQCKNNPVSKTFKNVYFSKTDICFILIRMPGVGYSKDFHKCR